LLLAVKVSEERGQWRWQPRKGGVCESFVKTEAKLSVRDEDEAEEGKEDADFRWCS